MDSIRKNSPLLDHFWKLFALAVFAAAAYAVWCSPHPGREPISGTVSVSTDQARLILAEGGAAVGTHVTAHLATGGAVSGPVHSFEGSALVLRVGSELDVIPWRNVVKVRVHER